MKNYQYCLLTFVILLLLGEEIEAGHRKKTPPGEKDYVRDVNVLNRRIVRRELLRIAQQWLDDEELQQITKGNDSVLLEKALLYQLKIPVQPVDIVQIIQNDTFKAEISKMLEDPETTTPFDENDDSTVDYFWGIIYIMTSVGIPIMFGLCCWRSNRNRAKEARKYEDYVNERAVRIQEETRRRNNMIIERQHAAFHKKVDISIVADKKKSLSDSDRDDDF